MGVEYQQCFFVRDLNWVGDQGVLARVHAALTKWRLADAPPAVYDIDDGRKRKHRAKLGAIKNPPQNMLAEWPEAFDAATIPQIMGPSYYPASQIGERYIQQIVAVVGTDFRVFAGGGTFDVEVERPPTVQGIAAKKYDEERLGHACFYAYEADAVARPPVARLPADRSVYGHLIPPGFGGVWRAGLILDCGKDCRPSPAKSRPVPGTAFAADLAEAFGTELVQIGFFY
jgi:hypothetical protein